MARAIAAKWLIFNAFSSAHRAGTHDALNWVKTQKPTASETQSRPAHHPQMEQIMSKLITTKIVTPSRVTDTLVTVKAVGLFFAAPFIGLLYLVLLPFVGLGTLAWIAGKALAAHHQVVFEGLRSAAKIAAAPFIGLAFILLLPLVGLVMMATVTARTMTLAPQAH
jgi:hypothetical protein